MMKLNKLMQSQWEHPLELPKPEKHQLDAPKLPPDKPENIPEESPNLNKRQ